MIRTFEIEHGAPDEEWDDLIQFVRDNPEFFECLPYRPKDVHKEVHPLPSGSGPLTGMTWGEFLSRYYSGVRDR